MSVYQDANITAKVNDGVCEGDLSDPVFIKVDYPNAITPYAAGSPNAIFLDGIDFQMYVFNRYGQKVFSGKGGWNGTYKGKVVDPGTYYYVITFDNGEERKATVEVIKE